MRYFLTGLLLLALGLLTAPRPAAANDQIVVIGAGLGIHSFSSTDDVRKGSALFAENDEIKAGAADHLYAEWYALGSLGFGVRLMAIAAGRSYSSAGAKLEQVVTVSGTMVTVNWVPAGSESYTRFGVAAGIGPARYQLNEKYTNDFTPSEDYDESASSSGTVSLLGAYVDWGGEGFGARFGLDYHETDLDKLDTPSGELDVDGTGAAWYFDLRWAFN